MYHDYSLNFNASILLAFAEFFADDEGTCLLYSGGNLDSAKQSFLSLFPYETVTVYDHQLHHHKDGYLQQFKVQNPWQGLQDHFFSSLATEENALAFGWLGYGMGAYADEDKVLPYRLSRWPDAYWQRSAIVLTYDHSLQQASIKVDLSVSDQVNEKAKEWIQKFSTLEGCQLFIDNLEVKLFVYPPFTSAKIDLNCLKRHERYVDKIKQAQDLIREGEIYQVNLAQSFEFQTKRSSFSLFRQMCTLNPAPFSAYFRYHQISLVSTSPERFLYKKGEILETRPIKGTIPRGKTVEEDGKLKMKLLNSPKERAELVMITDLMRNDLGKLSQAGTVKTIDLWRCEAFTNVFHLSALIQSIVKDNLKPLEIIRSSFPPGSITGCPKLRAMEVIDHLENHPRGIYTGSMGYVTSRGDFDLNIMIRTLIIEKNSVFLQLGAGIVIDSVPEQEYEETLHKGASLFHILQTGEKELESFE